MSLAKSIAAVALALAAAAPAHAAKDTVVGRLNLKTGNFTRFQPASTAASSTYTGIVQVTLTIQVKSALPANQAYLCGLDVSVFDPSSESEGPNADATVSATASGGVLKCTVTIPYSWVLATGSSTVTASARWNVFTVQGSTEGPSREIGGGFASFNPETSNATKLSAIGEI